MNFYQAMDEMERMIDGFNFDDGHGDVIPAPMILMIVDQFHGDRLVEEIMPKAMSGEMDGTEYFKIMKEMFEEWLKFRFQNEVFKKFVRLSAEKNTVSIP